MVIAFNQERLRFFLECLWLLSNNGDSGQYFYYAGKA